MKPPSCAHPNPSASKKSPALPSPPAISPPPRPRLRRLPHRPPHPRRRTPSPSVNPLIPGHQIVGKVVSGATPSHPLGTRLGVSWIGGTDGTCPHCLQRRREPLRQHPIFTGYTVDGGPLNTSTSAPTSPTRSPTGPRRRRRRAAALCRYHRLPQSPRRRHPTRRARRALRLRLLCFARHRPSSVAWNCEVYVVTRGESHRQPRHPPSAHTWVGTEDDKPPAGSQLDRAITFAPAGKVIVHALSCLRKGGIVAINAIHLDQMPAFDYDTLLWGERQIRSVANMTRQDARDFLATRRPDRHPPPSPTASPSTKPTKPCRSSNTKPSNGPFVIVP